MKDEEPRPLIGISLATIGAAVAGEPPLWGMRSSYATVLLAHQATPVFLPQFDNLADLGPLTRQLAGLLLPDGADIDPARYHQPAAVGLEATDPARDQTELILAQWALARQLPILAIARGMHLVNVAAGGTLYQDIPADLELPTEHRRSPVAYANLAHHGHLIRLEPASRLSQLVGHSEIWVNSMHHQAIKKLGAGLQAVAHSADQVIEGLESSTAEHWLIGLQCHPEAMASEAWTNHLFAAFVTAARDYQAALL